MHDIDPDKKFDRLAGQRPEPSAGTRELIQHFASENPVEISVDLGHAPLGERTYTPTSKNLRMLSAWTLVILLTLVLLVGIAFIYWPLVRESQVNHEKLRTAHQHIAKLLQKIDNLETQRAELEASLAALLQETESRAATIEELHRNEEQRAASIIKESNNLRSKRRNTYKKRRNRKR